MLPALIVAILLCLLLAGVATAASCLIPELTVAGIWCIPVLGFALLVGAIFRIAVYYDPREAQSPEAWRYSGYVALALLAYLLTFSSVDIIFTKGQHIAVIIGSILGILTILGTLAFGEYIWVIKQTPANVFPLIFQLRRFVFINCSSLYLLASVFSMEDLRSALKPVIIFFAYASCIAFATIYSGVYRERLFFNSNGTIRQQLTTWVRSKMQPGSLLSSMHTILTILIFVILIIQRLCVMPSKYSPIGKGLFLGFAAVSFYTATLYDPRKPPETSKVKERVFGMISFLSFDAYVDWNVQNIPRYTNEYHDHYVAMIILNLVGFLLVIAWYLYETSDIVLEMRKLISFLCKLAMYNINIHAYIFITTRDPYSQWRIVAHTIFNGFYYLVVLSIVAVIAGINREVVRQVPPVQVLPVQVPPEVRMELSRPPPEEDSEQSPMKGPPFNRHPRIIAEAIDV